MSRLDNTDLVRGIFGKSHFWALALASCSVSVMFGCSGSDSTAVSGSGGGGNNVGGASAVGGAATGGSTMASPVGGAPASGGAPATGGTGATSPQPSGGSPAAGGAATGGAATGGNIAATGGKATGGTGTGGQLSSGGAGVGGTSNGIGGSARSTGGTTSSGTGGTTSSSTGGTTKSATGGATSASSGGGSSGGAAGGSGAVQSAGCGKTRTLQNGTLNITYSGASRKYILLVPSSYDNSYAYRLVFAFAESGSSAQSVATRNYFTMATYDTKNTIFVAPDASDGAGTWSNTDVGFTDAILAQLEGDLCIDKTRVFATGFSFGAGMAMALACTRADVFRAVAFFSGADLTNSCPTTLTKPIAYYASQASQDANGMSPTNPMTGEMKQAQFAAVNGCTAEPASTTFPAAGQPHTCTIYKGCSAGHPTEYCVFNGAHGWQPVDPGQSTSWDSPEAWKFITQF